MTLLILVTLAFLDDLVETIVAREQFAHKVKVLGLDQFYYLVFLGLSNSHKFKNIVFSKGNDVGLSVEGENVLLLAHLEKDLLILVFLDHGKS